MHVSQFSENYSWSLSNRFKVKGSLPKNVESFRKFYRNTFPELVSLDLLVLPVPIILKICTIVDYTRFLKTSESVTTESIHRNLSEVWKRLKPFSGFLPSSLDTWKIAWKSSELFRAFCKQTLLHQSTTAPLDKNAHISWNNYFLWKYY